MWLLQQLRYSADHKWGEKKKHARKYCHRRNIIFQAVCRVRVHHLPHQHHSGPFPDAGVFLIIRDEGFGCVLAHCLRGDCGLTEHCPRMKSGHSGTAECCRFLQGKNYNSFVLHFLWQNSYLFYFFCKCLTQATVGEQDDHLNNEYNHT